MINSRPNGLNINRDAGLQKFVVEKGLDVGFTATCVDEKGNVISGDCGRGQVYG